MTSVIQTWYDASVFRRMPAGVDTRDALVVFFHRASATKYLVVALWGVASIIFGVNTFIILWDRDVQVIYSIAVVIAAVSAAIGATWYNKIRSLELFAGSSTLCLIFVYPLALFARVIVEHDPKTIPLGILALGLLVLPACRTVFIFKWDPR